MSNSNDSLIDKDGNVHEKGWDGQYHPKQGMFGPERDVSFPRQPNVERDLLRNPVEARDPLSNPIRSTSGDSLFHRLGNATGGSGAAGGIEGPLSVIALLALMGAGLVLIALWVVLIPVAFAGSGIWVLTKSSEGSVRQTVVKRILGVTLIGIGIVSGVVLISTGAFVWSFQILEGALQVLFWILKVAFLVAAVILQPVVLMILLMLPIWVLRAVYNLMKKQ